MFARCPFSQLKAKPGFLKGLCMLKVPVHFHCSSHSLRCAGVHTKARGRVTTSIFRTSEQWAAEGCQDLEGNRRWLEKGGAREGGISLAMSFVS